MSIDKVSMVVSPAESKLHIRSSTRSAKSAILPHRSANQVQLDSKNILFYFHPLAGSAPLLPYYKLLIDLAHTLGPQDTALPLSRDRLSQQFSFPCLITDVSIFASILHFARSRDHLFFSLPSLSSSSMRINLSPLISKSIADSHCCKETIVE